ncbi:Uncharacterised protein [Vibrio cholerae]|nr:Uncharacterised protein [Vibrio cholerae]
MTTYFRLPSATCIWFAAPSTIRILAFDCQSCWLFRLVFRRYSSEPPQPAIWKLRSFT